jgi:hypothetical protein
MGVVITGLNVEKILKIPKIQSGTGQLQAETVYKELKQWKIESNVVAMSLRYDCS